MYCKGHAPIPLPDMGARGDITVSDESEVEEVEVLAPPRQVVMGARRREGEQRLARLEETSARLENLMGQMMEELRRMRMEKEKEVGRAVPLGGAQAQYEDGLGPLVGGEAFGASAFIRPRMVPPHPGIGLYQPPLYLEDERCLMEARLWRGWFWSFPGWGGVMFGALKAGWQGAFGGAFGGGVNYDKSFIVDVLIGLIREPILEDAAAESARCELVLQFADKLSLKGKNFPKGLWEVLCLSRSSVGDAPGQGIVRYDNALNLCAKRQKASGVWSTGFGAGSGAGRGGGGGGRGSWGGRGRGASGDGSGGVVSPGRGK